MTLWPDKKHSAVFLRCQAVATLDILPLETTVQDPQTAVLDKA
jgi:hypothetical protein